MTPAGGIERVIATQWAKDNNVDSLVGNINANYRWAGTGAPNTFFTKMTDGTLTILDFDGKAKVIDVEDSFDRLMKNGCTNYLEFSFPKLYHGIIRKSVLEKIKQETGTYLKGLSPDIYSAISLACHVNKLIVIDYPLSIPGVCGQSTSITEGQLKKHSKKLEDAPHFRDRGDYQWSKEVPKIYCVQTIWADSGFAALREMKRTDLIEKFDKYMLYANIINADPTLSTLVNEHILQNDIQENDFDKTKFSISKLKVKMKDFMIRGSRRGKIILKLKELRNITSLPDIHHAMNALTEYLEKRKINFIKNLNEVK